MINIRAPHLQNNRLNKQGFTHTNSKRSSGGFTIIEIMIVLAVASLIMLIVFLAVPALQRNARNTNRTADATKIASSVNECLSNRNNVTTSCDASTEIVGVTLDTTTLRQLTTVNVNPAATSPPATPGAFPANTNTANVYYNTKCGTDGSSYLAGNSQQFVVLYNNESSAGTSVNRCISG